MIKVIGVVGAGQMGNGIAHLFAQHGFAVILHDIAEIRLSAAITTIRANLERQVKKEVVAAGEVEEIVGRIMPTTDISDLSRADFVVEAVPEDETLKFQLFRKLDKIVGPDVILASNTSSISISRIAAVTSRPERVIGMHFMNPPPVMRLVEVIRGRETASETFAVTAAQLAALGKEMAVACDTPGFIVNRILIPMINEAIFALYEGVANAEDIDKGMHLGANFPMGPLALADLIGLDTVLAIINVLHDGFKEAKYLPCPLIIEMVAAGKLGRKSGQGFFSYGDNLAAICP